jgi:demethylmenaquinone methyltransferase/2-methoxy-6-polyprenyl-1,4-benzoquinol methylase
MSHPEGAPRSALPVRDGSGAMFDAIAPRYDLLNRILSMGMDQGWRKKAIAALDLGPGDRVLDVATGTGDLAMMACRLVPGACVEGLDPSAQMLSVGRRKIADAGLADRIAMTQGDALALPYPDHSFDGAMVAFGIRNFPDRLAGLREMARVTRPGRRVVVLELSEPEGGLLGLAARFHIHVVVPRLGALLSGAREYAYLQRSIAAFPPPAEFRALMQRAGLRDVTNRPLSFGAVQLFCGTA